MSFDANYAIEVFKKTLGEHYWDVDGRTSRLDFWHYFACWFALYILSLIPILGFFAFLILIALIPPNISIAIRRMHDIGQPWYMSLIPIYNIYLAAQPGDPGPNVYGPAPSRMVNVADHFD